MKRSDRVTDRSERIGKKPNEADLSYTAVCTGLSKIFSVRKYGKEAKGRKRGSERDGGKNLERAEGAIEDEICRAKKRLPTLKNVRPSGRTDYRMTATRLHICL